MKLNLANPSTGLQKIVEVDDDKKLLPFYEKRIGAEVDMESIGEEFKGYIFKITGGNDKQGFPMMQGILVNHRVRLLFTKGMKCYRPRRTGEKKRKSVRGCIVGPDLAVMNLTMVKKGPEDIPGLTDGEKPRRLGPKRAGNIRKLFNLAKEDDVRGYVVRRTLEGKKTKAPKIQRLITASRIQRKRREKAMIKKHVKTSQAAAAAYLVMMQKYRTAQKEKRFQEVAKKKNVNQPVQAKPAQAKPTQAKPAQAKPTQVKPTQAKPGQVNPATATKQVASAKQKPKQQPKQAPQTKPQQPQKQTQTSSKQPAGSQTATKGKK